MEQESRSGKIQAFVEVRCLCGKVHTFLRDKALDELGIGRWKCAACKRRFVIACTPGANGHSETYWPLFLEQVPSTGATREDGLSADGTNSSEPPELHFRCRCGCRLVGKSSIFGRPTKCPRCRSALILTVGYESERGRPAPLLEYLEGPSGGGAPGRA